MHRDYLLPILTFITLHFSNQSAAIAQIKPDGTTATQVQGNLIAPLGNGTVNGSNLYHSFEQFNVPSAGVIFGAGNSGINGAAIQNILNRVTGDTPSAILGSIQSRVDFPNANLYLLNPNGIVFGQNARLDIGGSFLASTATGLGFQNSQLFTADRSKIFPTGDPKTLYFSLAQPAAILNQGNLSVNQGQNISLVGGTIFSSGDLTAPAGSVALLAVPGNSQVELRSPDAILGLSIQQNAITSNWQGKIADIPQLARLLTGQTTSSSTSEADRVVVKADGSLSILSNSATLADNDIPLTESTAIVSGKINVLGLLSSSSSNLSQNAADNIASRNQSNFIFIYPTSSNSSTSKIHKEFTSSSDLNAINTVKPNRVQLGSGNSNFPVGNGNSNSPNPQSVVLLTSEETSVQTDNNSTSSLINLPDASPPPLVYFNSREIDIPFASSSSSLPVAPLLPSFSSTPDVTPEVLPLPTISPPPPIVNNPPPIVNNPPPPPIVNNPLPTISPNVVLLPPQVPEKLALAELNPVCLQDFTRTRADVDLKNNNLASAFLNLEKTYIEEIKDYYYCDRDINSLAGKNINSILSQKTDSLLIGMDGGRELIADISDRTGVITALVYPIILSDRLEVLVIPPKNLGNPFLSTVYEAPLEKIKSVIQAFNINLRDPSSQDYLVQAQQLYDWIIRPVDKQLKDKKVQTLVFVMDGLLRGTPMSALHDGKQFLVEQYSSTNIPALSLTNLQSRDRNNSRILAMGLSDSIEGFTALPGVETEVKTIAINILNGSAFLNQPFTIDNLLSERQRQDYGIIHLATHAQFINDTPDGAFIQFWNNKLRLNQIAKLRLDQPLVEMLTLSACQTAVGSNLGLGGLAVSSGAKSVLASLWAVSDAGTVPLMISFYTQWKEAPTKAVALQQSQLSIIRKQVRFEAGKIVGIPSLSSVPINQEGLKPISLSHPFFWSPFILIGNWL